MLTASKKLRVGRKPALGLSRSTLQGQLSMSLEGPQFVLLCFGGSSTLQWALIYPHLPARGGSALLCPWHRPYHTGPQEDIVSRHNEKLQQD